MIDYNTEKEVWKDVKDYEGYYQISNHGNFRSVDRLVERSDGTTARYKGKEIMGSVNNLGYRRFTLSKDGKATKELAHRLVGKHFVPNPHEFEEINHIDENKLNNKADNLEWCTRWHNLTHGSRLKNMSYKVRRTHIATGEVKIYPSASSVREDGFDQGHVSRVCRGEKQTHKGYTWEYI